MKLLAIFFLLCNFAFATETEYVGKLIVAPKLPVPTIHGTVPTMDVSDPRGTNAAALPLTLAELKQGCTDPHHYNNQNAPSKIEVMCLERSCQWGMRPHGRRPSERVVDFGSMVTTSKANLRMGEHYWRHERRGGDVECQVMQFYCQREVRSNMLNCDELLAINSMREYCEANMLELEVESLAVRVNVGEAKILCPGIVTPRGHQQN